MRWFQSMTSSAQRWMASAGPAEPADDAKSRLNRARTRSIRCARSGPFQESSVIDVAGACRAQGDATSGRMNHAAELPLAALERLVERATGTLPPLRWEEILGGASVRRFLRV